MTQQEREKRLYTFRIKYNYGDYHSAEDSYHYYSAFSAEQALEYHCFMMERKNLKCQTLSIERQCPWTDDWEDYSSPELKIN
jgi:hypothetical protein